MPKRPLAASEAKRSTARIGIIGAENSHAAEYGRIFNKERTFPGFEVVGIYGETDEFAAAAARDGDIPWIATDPAEFFGRIDALIVDHRHAKYHLAAAWPFVESGIPTFVDKPFCYRVEEGIEFLAMARRVGTPVTSFSGLSRGPEVEDLRAQLAELDSVRVVMSIGHCDVESPWGGVYFYGMHQIQRLMELCGDDIDRVIVNRSGGDAIALLHFASGLQATVFFAKGRPPFDVGVVTDQGFFKLEPRVEPDEMAPYQEIVDLFSQGIEARSHNSLLRETAVLEAVERSVSSGGWEDVEQVDQAVPAGAQ